ncbi:MAG: hypothetical protein ACO3E4_05640 [Candidatus Nanopelagicaceae bacterium]
MAESRTLKLSILADVDDLKKKLSTGSQEVEGFGTKLANFGKKAAVAFAVATAAAVAYAGKLAIDGVKAAIEDEAAQAKLATTLGNVTGATEKQIASVEKAILAMSLQTGVADDKLRPSLDRLVRATGDVTEAQQLQKLALDIAAGTGKDLSAVTEALGKAYDGNLGAIRRLGVGLDAAIIKNKDFDGAVAALSKTFEGQATVQADTFAGKMARLKVAFDEAKETVGSFILDAITPIIDNIVNKVIPAVSNFIESMGGKKGITSAFNDFVATAKTFIIPIIEGIQNAFQTVKKAVEDNREELEAIIDFAKRFLLPFFGGALKLAIEGIAKAFALVLDVIGGIVNGLEAMIRLGKSIGGAVSGVFGGGKAMGGPVNAGTTYLVGEQGPELFTPSTYGNIVPNNKLSTSGQTININVSGAIDPSSTARQIVELLNREASLSGSFSNIGSSYLVTG